MKKDRKGELVEIGAYFSEEIVKLRQEFEQVYFENLTPISKWMMVELASLKDEVVMSGSRRNNSEIEALDWYAKKLHETKELRNKVATILTLPEDQIETFYWQTVMPSLCELVDELHTEHYSRASKGFLAEELWTLLALPYKAMYGNPEKDLLIYKGHY